MQDFTATDSADISAGASYTVSVTMGTCGGTYPGTIAAWIDFNADGDFDDAGEQLGATQITHTPRISHSLCLPLRLAARREGE